MLQDTSASKVKKLFRGIQRRAGYRTADMSRPYPPSLPSHKYNYKTFVLYGDG